MGEAEPDGELNGYKTNLGDHSTEDWLLGYPLSEYWFSAGEDQVECAFCCHSLPGQNATWQQKEQCDSGPQTQVQEAALAVTREVASTELGQQGTRWQACTGSSPWMALPAYQSPSEAPDPLYPNHFPDGTAGTSLGHRCSLPGPSAASGSQDHSGWQPIWENSSEPCLFRAS